MSNKSPIEWAKLPLQKYAQFTGRAPRPEYWWYILGVVIAFLVASFVDNALGMGGLVLGLYGPLSLLLLLGTFVPSLAVGIRRLHDSNRPGWWVAPPYLLYAVGLALAGPSMASGEVSATTGLAGILMLLAGIFGIVLLIFYCLPGTAGDNQYGPDPYARGE